MNQQITKSTITNLNMLHGNPPEARCQGKTFIYALNDPVTGVCRYIGKADDPRERLRNHLRLLGGVSHKNSWLRSLSPKVPVLEILREVPVDGWEVWERAFIQVYRERGFKLVNSTEGGDGLTNPSADVRGKIGSANRGRMHSKEARKKITEALRRRPINPSTGVYFRRGSFVAFVNSCGKSVYLGSFKTFDLALLARIMGEIKYWGTPAQRTA